MSAFESCPRPCTEVAYTFQAEPFTANTAEELRELSQCSWLERPSLLALQFSRKIQFEYVSSELRTGSEILNPMLMSPLPTLYQKQSGQ